MSRGSTERSTAWLLRSHDEVWDAAATAPCRTFDEACAAHSGQAVTLWISAHLLHQLVCEPGLPLRDDDAVRGYARQLFMHHHGSVARHWALGAWSSGPARGASALHGADLAALQAAAQRHQVRLQAVRPWWSAVLQRLVRTQPAWAQAPRAKAVVVEGSLVTWLQLARGRCVEVRHGWLGTATVPALLAALCDEGGSQPGPVPTLVCGYGLSGDRPSREGVTWLDGLALDGPGPEWLPAPPPRHPGVPPAEMLPIAASPPALSWAVTAAAALWLATAAWPVWQSHEEAEALRAQAEALPAPGRPTATTARPPTAAADDPAARLAGWSATLQHPWGEVLAAVEGAAAKDTHWLLLEHRVARHELRLEGVAGHASAALQAAEALRAQPHWRDAKLLRVQAESGGTAQRFELSASSEGTVP